MSVARARPAALPDASGHFGRFGGRFVPETLMQPLVDLEKAYRAARGAARVRRRQRELVTTYAGRRYYDEGNTGAPPTESPQPAH